MQNRIGIGIGYGLLLAVTVGYIGAVWVGLKAFETVAGPDGMSNLPTPTIYLANPEMIGIWVVLALLSFFSNAGWGIYRKKHSELPEPHLLPMLCHALWLLLFTFLHLWAAGLAFYPICSEIC